MAPDELDIELTGAVLVEITVDLQMLLLDTEELFLVDFYEISCVWMRPEEIGLLLVSLNRMLAIIIAKIQLFCATNVSR